MTETKKRIKAYKAALPGLRQRIISVALLLAMSIAMMSSATFAWLTISRRPEVKGMSTTVTANGNLEVALVTGDGKTVPGESKVGDSSAAEGQSVVDSNVTWGNLINLSDESYGLENLILRPAQLNTASLLDSPLYGAVYGEDGRITQLSSNFGYATWTPADGDKPGYFGVSENYGVRAISSTKIEAVGAAALYYNMVSNANNLNLAAANQYVALGNNDKYMPSLATMMGLYMTARMNSSDEDLSNPTCSIEDIQNLRDMYAAFLEAFDMEAEAMAALVNLQRFLNNGEGNYVVCTAEEIYASTTSGLKAEGVQVTDLEQFIKDRGVIASDLEKLKTICESGTSLKWKDSGLNTIVNNLVNVGACTIGTDNTPISSIGASNAVGYLSGTQEARITNGILYRFEERTGGYIEVKNLSISATVKRSGITIPASVKANIQTTASRDYNLFNNDMTYAESLNTGNYKGGIPVAEDTYGLAVDLWVRTNAVASYLTLEGNVLTETSEVRAVSKDANGNQVELYTVKLSAEDEEGNAVSYSLDLYQVVTKETAEDGTETEVTVWYKADSHAVMTEEELGGVAPLPKMETVVTVTGYEGENRVWGDNELLSTDSTTQGSGSCYVYYADTPEDQARSLKLLEAFNVAFVNDQGKLMATAVMDTEHYYAASGRVIVPLVLSTSNSINLGEDYTGQTTYAITALEQNVPTRVTAIVYLDGTKLTNQEVLAAADIQGQLNIQFGSSEPLNPIGNETLENAERRISASVDKTSFDYDTAAEPMTSTVTVTVDGDEPTTVTAFFLRAINATQGAREQVMTFQKDDSGKWVSTYTFTSPGNYVLRTVQLDGVDYVLDSPLSVTVTGFTVASLSCTQATENNHVSVMTAANSSSVDLKLKFTTDDETKLPTTVKGRYLNEADGSVVNVDFVYSSSGIWTGSATFRTSGDYTLQYLVVNGEYMELDSAMWQTASVVLGMRVAVYTTSPHSFKYIPSEMADNEKLLGIQVKIMDNADNEMPGLSGAKLTYSMKGSGIKTMDTDLTWDGSYYVGELTTTGPGIWQFSNVVVGSNVLTNATSAPTFTVLSPEPPQYYDHATVTYQYKPNNDAVMNAQITNSAAATVWALIVKDGETEGTWVEGTIGGELTTTDGKSANQWYFKVPTDANGYQDGNWTLTQLKLWDVFAADGTAYTEESPLLMDVSDTNNVTKVVNRIYVSFAEDKSQNFGVAADGTVTGSFMDSYTISGLNVDIKDFEGNKVEGVSDVQLTFTYQSGSSASYGHYTSDQLTNATEGATITIALNSNSGTTYSQSTDAAIIYAGSYNTTFSFKISGATSTYTGTSDDNAKNTKALPKNAPVFTVSSKAARVMVTATNPKPGTTYRVYTVNEPETAGQAVSGDFFRFTDYAASVYIYTPVKSGNYDQEAAHAYAPEVTLTLYDMPSGYSNAAMTFTTTKTNSVNSTFTFGSGTTAKAAIGKAVDGTEDWLGSNVSTYPKSYPAGMMTQNVLTLDYNGMSYSITLAHTISIEQPQAPAVAVFEGIPSTYTKDDKPTTVVGDGTFVEVMLPELTWTATIERAADGNATWSAYTAVETISDYQVYGFKEYTTGSWIKTEHKDYQYYEWTKFQSSYTGVTNIYKQDMKISSWIINGTEYNAGEKVSLNGEGTIAITAVVTNVGSERLVDTKTQTSYKYLYGYVKGDELETTKVLGVWTGTPTGTQIGSKVTSSSAAYPAPALADTSTADATTDTTGTNMTTDSGAYEQYWP